MFPNFPTTTHTLKRYQVTSQLESSCHILPFRMERIPQELVDKLIDELADDPEPLRVCSLISRRWVGRSRHHLFRLINFPRADKFTRYRNMFPVDHSVHSCVRTLVITQPPREALRSGLEHLKAFRGLESLTLTDIINRPTEGQNTIEFLAEGLGDTLSVKSLKLIQWRVSPTTLMEFICRFPSLKDLNIERMDFLLGLPRWKLPSRFPRFTGRLDFVDRDSHGTAEKFLRLLARLPLAFREISIEAASHGAPDLIITILEKCSPVLTNASLRYVYPPGAVASFCPLLRANRPGRLPGATVRGINASFPELRGLTLKPYPGCTGIVDDLTLKLLSVVSSPYLSQVTLNHTASHKLGPLDTNKLREADRTMFELTQRIGRSVSFGWDFRCSEICVELAIRPHLKKIDGLGALRISGGGGVTS